MCKVWGKVYVSFWDSTGAHIYSMKIKVTKSLQDDGKFEYRIKVRKWFVWAIEYKSKDPEEIRKIYNRMLKSPNIEKA